jgi:hypothetical protein
VNAIGQVLGFDVMGVHRSGPGLRVDVGAGNIRLHNKQRHYPVAVFSATTVPAGAKQARAYLIDPEVGADKFANGSCGWAQLHLDFDPSTPRGVYPDGVIVVAVVKVPAMDRHTRGEYGATVKRMRSDIAQAMTEVKSEFESWQAFQVHYDNDADFARKMQSKYPVIKNEGSIKNACTRWRHEKKSSC